jgi:predicted ferric reductase
MTAVLLIAGPLLLASGQGWPAGRPFAAELGSSLGIAALGVLALLVVLPARLRAFEGLGADVAVRLHRRLATSFAVLLGAHVLLVIAASPARMVLFEFAGQPWRAQAAIGATVALVALGLTSARRRDLGLSYPAWRALHGTLAVTALVLTAVHTVGWDRYLMHGLGPLALLAATALPIAAVVRLRVARPMLLAEEAYVVEHVRPERGDAVTVHLRADGHRGAPFRPGQFAWIKLADAPLGVDEHPFSYVSSAEHPDSLAFTIRAYDGFSARAAQLTPGTRVLVDGPHGAFAARPGGPGMVLVAAGIGITPSMSILRTAADRNDRRRFVLIYGSRTAGDITFLEELESLRRRLDLDVHHVLSRPDAGWTGLRGRLDANVMARVLPTRLRGWQFFLCGSGPAVAGALTALARNGVPPEQVHAERFVEV